MGSEGCREKRKRKIMDLLVDVDDFCRREAVEPGGGSVAVGANVLGVNRSSISSSGNSSDWEIVSRPSQVWPKTAQISVRPFLNAFR